MIPHAATGPASLQADLSSASSLPATPVMVSDGPAMPQSDRQAIPRTESGAAEGPIESPTSATPLAPGPAQETASSVPSFWSRLVAWYVSTFKR
jgi:hypothetical protein